jgi:hypothetical protein
MNSMKTGKSGDPTSFVSVVTDFNTKLKLAALYFAQLDSDVAMLKTVSSS